MKDNKSVICAQLCPVDGHFLKYWIDCISLAEFSGMKIGRNATGSADFGIGLVKARSVNVTKKSLDGKVAIGDVVTLQDRIELMSVEAVRKETFGVVLDCIWFDKEDCLRYRRFPLNAIDVFPRDDQDRFIERGMEVRLRSRGPVMTVQGLTERAGLRYAECCWNGPMGRERRRLFPINTLVLTIMERFEGQSGQYV